VPTLQSSEVHIEAEQSLRSIYWTYR